MKPSWVHTRFVLLRSRTASESLRVSIRPWLFCTSSCEKGATCADSSKAHRTQCEPVPTVSPQPRREQSPEERQFAVTSPHQKHHRGSLKTITMSPRVFQHNMHTEFFCEIRKKITATDNHDRPWNLRAQQPGRSGPVPLADSTTRPGKIICPSNFGCLLKERVGCNHRSLSFRVYTKLHVWFVAFQKRDDYFLASTFSKLGLGLCAFGPPASSLPSPLHPTPTIK